MTGRHLQVVPAPAAPAVDGGALAETDPTVRYLMHVADTAGRFADALGRVADTLGGRPPRPLRVRATRADRPYREEQP